MKCYNHRDQDAVGVCLACFHGVCEVCAVDMTRALACKNRCEQEVRRLLDLRDFSFAQPSRSDSLIKSSAGVQMRSAIFLIAIGAIMGGFGLYDRRFMFLVWIGIAEVAFGVLNLWKVWTRPRTDQFRLCPKCGYNVTGNTSGRCPECNYQV